MAQHDYIIANQSGAAFRSDVNGALAAGVTQNSGAAEPAVTYAYMPWADVTSGIFKIRNAGNNGWISLFLLDCTASFIPPNAGLITNAGISASAAIALSKLATGALPTAITVANANIVSPIADTNLATIATAGKVSNSATTAASANTANAIVTRDASGNFSAGTVAAALTGTASGNSRLVRTAEVATTSGTSIDFAGIPSWARRITVALNGVSTNGTGLIQIQLGDSGGIETSGYVGSNFVIAALNNCNVASFSSGFVFGGSTAVETRHGALILTNSSGNNWLAIGNYVLGTTGHSGGVQGEKATSATLDRIRITADGINTFDAGSVNIIYEG